MEDPIGFRPLSGLEPDKMKKPNVALIGTSGFADYYLQVLLEACKDEIQLTGVVDPFVKRSPAYNRLTESEIPMFRTVEELYADKTVDALIVVSPPRFHKEQCAAGLRHGSVVLCEKPIVPTIQDAYELMRLEDIYKSKIGVGFQWCFSKALKDAKADLMAGRYGTPVLLKVMTSWPRGKKYYSSSWHGHLIAEDGTYLLDSVVTNAMAHYLHNIFYVLGKTQEESMEPSWVQAGLYRVKDIQSFDTCTIRGGFADGGQFLFLGTHASDQTVNTKLSYQFEKGSLLLDENAGGHLTGRMNDGTEKDYGPLSEPASARAKVETLLDVYRGKAGFPCIVPSTVPHVKVTNFIIEHMPIARIPDRYIEYDDPNLGAYMPSINEVFTSCYSRGKTPAELGIDWANETKLSIEGYDCFTGEAKAVYG